MPRKAKAITRKPERKRVRVPAIVIALEFMAGSLLTVKITESAIKKMLDHPSFTTVAPPLVVAFFERLMPQKGRGRKSRKAKGETDVVFTQPGGVEGKPN